MHANRRLASTQQTVCLHDSHDHNCMSRNMVVAADIATAVGVVGIDFWSCSQWYW